MKLGKRAIAILIYRSSSTEETVISERIKMVINALVLKKCESYFWYRSWLTDKNSVSKKPNRPNFFNLKNEYPSSPANFLCFIRQSRLNPNICMRTLP
jgi:hypothetical protein